MRTLVALLTWTFIWNSSNAQDNSNLNLLYNWKGLEYTTDIDFSFTGLTGYNNGVQDVGVIGTPNKTIFLDLSSECQYEELFIYDHTGSDTYFRAYEVYNNYVFSVCDNCDEGLIIFDATSLIPIVSNQTEAFFNSAKSIFVDKSSDRLFVVGSDDNQDILVLDISTPQNPLLVGSITLESGDYINNIEVKDEVMYLSNGYSGIQVWNIQDLDNPFLLVNSIDDLNYNSKIALSSNSSTLFSIAPIPVGNPINNYEFTGMGQSITGISSISSFAEALGSNGNPTASDLYVSENKLYVSYFEDGIKVFDIQDPNNPNLIAYYDSYLYNKDKYLNYSGALNVFRIENSEKILLTDLNNGLFVFELIEGCGGVDLDGDGYCSLEDCDDEDPNVHPGMVEKCDGLDNNCDGEIDNCILCFHPKVFLSGPYNDNTGLMHDDLNALNLIPTEEPYTKLSFGLVHGGNEFVDPAVFNDNGDNAIVDWIVLELRSSSDNTEVMYSRSALLQKDGDIVDIDGVSGISIDNIPIANSEYYLAVRHRNHLGVMTGGSVSLENSNIIDFTQGSLLVYGNNAREEIDLNAMGMWAGNANGNENIKFTGSDNDFDEIKNDILDQQSNFLNLLGFSYTSYENEDLNLDGVIKFSGSNNDIDLIKNNILDHPSNFLNLLGFSIMQQLP